MKNVHRHKHTGTCRGYLRQGKRILSPVLSSLAKDGIYPDPLSVRKVRRRVMGCVRSLKVLGQSKRATKRAIQCVIRFVLSHPTVITVTVLKALDRFILTGLIDGQWFRPSRFRSVIEMSKRNLQAARSVVSYWREVRSTPKLDLRAIRDPYLGIDDAAFEDEYGSLFYATLSELVTEKVIKQDPSSNTRFSWGKKNMQRVQSLAFYCSWHKGPNGPALFTAGRDLCALNQNPEQRRAVTRLLSFFGEGLPPFRDCQCQVNLSRVVPISDKGGKTRHIAIVDSWTQMALQPLHRTCMKMLLSIRFDYTHKQGAAVHSLKRSVCPKFSYDLKSATDRFPLFVQAKVVEAIWPGYSETWVIVCKRKFTSVSGVVSYSAGQPMGMLSSWAVFSLTHHVLVQTLFKLAGEKPVYWMVGDDVVIGSEKVGGLYTRLMQRLGVEISWSKSVLSPDGSSFEFTKRMVSNGKEISPISWGLLGEEDESPFTLLSALQSMYDRVDSPNVLSREALNGTIHTMYVRRWMLYLPGLSSSLSRTPKPAFTKQDVKEFKITRKLGELGDLERSLEGLLRQYSFSTFYCGEDDNYWLYQVLLEAVEQVQQCIWYIEKLRFKSRKIPHVSRNNPRKAERVYPSRSEYLALAVSFLRWWETLTAEKILDLVHNRDTRMSRPNQELWGDYRLAIQRKKRLPRLRDLVQVE